MKFGIVAHCDQASMSPLVNALYREAILHLVCALTFPVLAVVAKFYNEQADLQAPCDDLVERFCYCNLHLDLDF